MLDYLPEVVIDQPKASIWVNGAIDLTFTNFYGHMQITPETQVWLDEEQLPQVNIDFDNQFTQLIDAVNPVLANNIDWGAWRTVSTVTSGGGTTYGTIANVILVGGGVTTTTSMRTGIETQLVPGAITRETISGVADFSLQRFMQTTDENGDPFTISIDITGLMPNVDHACTIAGIPVDLTYDPSPVNAAGLAGTHTYQGKATTTTSNDGALTATIEMPAGVLAGNAVIKVFYYADPDISVAYANFYSAGLREQKQDTVIGIPTVSSVHTVINETSTTTEGGGYAEVFIGPLANDPLAQTFYLNSADYVSAVGLFFKSKSSSLGYTVELRNVVNGYPGTEIYASTHLTSAEINVSDDASLETVFTFPNVLRYGASQYWCFVGTPDQSNTDYNLWCSELGQIDILTGNRIVTQHANGGSLFHSENSAAWDIWTKRDLKFKVYKSNFENDCQVVFDNLTGVEASKLVLAFDEFVAPGTNVKWSYSVDGGNKWQAFNPYIDHDLGDIISQIKLRIDVTSTGGSYEIIDKYVGIILLYHDAAANYIGTNECFTDPLLYPNTINASAHIDADNVNS